MKIFLILLLAISWSCGIYAAFFENFPNKPPIFDFLFLATIGLNILCGIYLHAKASTKRFEWALFGLLANIGAVLIFRLWSFLRKNRKQGKSVLPD